MHVHIAPGNDKLGGIPNVSLTPGEACGRGVPCHKRCYAMKFLYRKEVRKAWQENYLLAAQDHRNYFTQIYEYLYKCFVKLQRKPAFFRWHVGGDFLDQNYLDCVVSLAERLPTVKFLAFTKRHDLDYRALPVNLTVVFSMWPGWGTTRKQMPRAWMQDGTETRVPANALHCPGGCTDCGMCWNLKDLGRDVVFHKH